MPTIAPGSPERIRLETVNLAGAIDSVPWRTAFLRLFRRHLITKFFQHGVTGWFHPRWDQLESAPVLPLSASYGQYVSPSPLMQTASRYRVKAIGEPPASLRPPGGAFRPLMIHPAW